MAQAPPAAGDRAPEFKEILQNQRVIVSSINLAPHEANAVHTHHHDMIAVFVNGGRVRNTVEGKAPEMETPSAGDVRFIPGGYTHTVTNEGTGPFHAVVVEFDDPQGKVQEDGSTSRTCTPTGSAKCVDEQYLFCTVKVCVEDVTMAPGAVSTRHGHPTDHMLVAISDYELSDDVQGKGTVARTRKSGEIEYIPAGITHRLTNVGSKPARFIVVLWR
jgi:quercetin dioxygenase-like cupin family protein